MLFRGIRFIQIDLYRRSGVVFGSVVEIENDVRLKGVRQLGWGKVKVGPVFEGEAIFSGEESMARIRLSDDSEINLQSNSLIVLQTEQVGQQAVINLKYGDMQLESTKPKTWSIQAQGKKVSIQTSEPKTRIKLNLKDKIEIKTIRGQAEIQASGANVSLKTSDEPVKIEASSQLPIQDISNTEYAPTPKITQEISLPTVQTKTNAELEPKKKPQPPQKAKPKIQAKTKKVDKKSDEVVVAKIPLPILRIKEPFKGAQIYFPGYEKKSVKFSWDPVPEADGYHIQFAQNESFNLIEYEGKLKRNELTYLFKKPTKVYWRVRAIRGVEEGPWSEPRSVQVSQGE